MDAILVLAAVATVATGMAIDGVRKLRLNTSVLESSLQFWQKRHATTIWDLALAQGSTEATETALVELMTARLGFTVRGAQAAVKIWKANGYGKARLGVEEIASR